jgi:U6 snRNA-associated Sm-like protein LSm1
MERLSLNDPPAGAQRGNTPQSFSQPQQNNMLGPSAPMTHGPPQLPPQMFTTAAQLLDLTDSTLNRLPEFPAGAGPTNGDVKRNWF